MEMHYFYNKKNTTSGSGGTTTTAGRRTKTECVCVFIYLERVEEWRIHVFQQVLSTVLPNVSYKPIISFGHVELYKSLNSSACVARSNVV